LNKFLIKFKKNSITITQYQFVVKYGSNILNQSRSHQWLTFYKHIRAWFY